MTLLEDVKMSVRVTSNATDAEIQMWIDAALADMRRVGIDPALLDAAKTLDPVAKAAVTCFVKANYVYDVNERPQFDASYRSLVCGLLNSGANLSAKGATRVV